MYKGWSLLYYKLYENQDIDDNIAQCYLKKKKKRFLPFILVFIPKLFKHIFLEKYIDSRFKLFV